MSGEWRDWQGGACPTDEKAEVRVRFAGGKLSSVTYKAGSLRWSHTDNPFDISAFQVVSVEEVQ